MNTGSNKLTKQAFNDMLGKGWDSGAQYSFCIQRALEGDPQFWWVPDVLRKFPHPPDWEQHERHPDGRYKSFPPGKSKGGGEAEAKALLKSLIKEGHVKEAREMIKLLRSYDGLAD